MRDLELDATVWAHPTSGDSQVRLSFIRVVGAQSPRLHQGPADRLASTVGCVSRDAQTMFRERQAEKGPDACTWRALTEGVGTFQTWSMSFGQ